MSLADRDYMKDLYGLLGISTQVSPADLRHAYEQAMSAATRSGDLVRARTLLGAYEALSSDQRERVYGRTFGAPGSTVSLPARPHRTSHKPRTRPPRPRKWGMSLPVRVLFFAIVVPGAVLTAVGNVMHLPTRTQSQPAGLPPVPGQMSSGPLQSVNATDAALYVEQLNERDDVTCALAGVDSTAARFTCRASDGSSWDVRGTSPADLTAVMTSPSMFRRSARFDAQAAVSAINDCRNESGALPPSARTQSVHATFACGHGVLTVYLRPGDSLDYDRIGPRAYRLIVTAGNGETVTYRSRANRHH